MIDILCGPGGPGRIRDLILMLFIFASLAMIAIESFVLYKVKDSASFLAPVLVIDIISLLLFFFIYFRSPRAKSYDDEEGLEDDAYIRLFVMILAFGAIGSTILTIFREKQTLCPAFAALFSGGDPDCLTATTVVVVSWIVPATAALGMLISGVILLKKRRKSSQQSRPRGDIERGQPLRHLQPPSRSRNIASSSTGNVYPPPQNYHVGRNPRVPLEEHADGSKWETIEL